MKKKNGFSAPEMIALIILLGVIFIGTTIKLSHVFDDNGEELYNMEVVTILNVAKNYGEKKVDELKENSMTITVGNLIEEGYLFADKESTYIDPRDNSKTLDDLKITLTYKSDKVVATLA